LFYFVLNPAESDFFAGWFGRVLPLSHAHALLSEKLDNFNGFFSQSISFQKWRLSEWCNFGKIFA